MLEEAIEEDTFHLEKHFPLRFRYPPKTSSPGLWKCDSDHMCYWLQMTATLQCGETMQPVLCCGDHFSEMIYLWRPQPPQSPTFSLEIQEFFQFTVESYIPPLQVRKTIDWKVLNGKGYVIVPRRVNINDIPGVTWLRRYMYIYIYTLVVCQPEMFFSNSWDYQTPMEKKQKNLIRKSMYLGEQVIVLPVFLMFRDPLFALENPPSFIWDGDLRCRKMVACCDLGPKQLGTKMFISWRWCKYFLGTSTWCSWALSKNVLKFLSKKAVFFQVQLWIKFGDFCIANLQSIPRLWDWGDDSMMASFWVAEFK